jgi:hypothetical protein
MSETRFFDVLPIRLQPYDDECLSGYLLRLAAANGVIDFRAFVQSLFPAWHNRRQVHVLRWEYPVDSWGALPLRTQLPVDSLARMTLLPWVAKFRTPPIRTDIRQLSPGQILRDLVHSTLQMCPLCLQEEKPYCRLLWRLQPVVACLKHRCRLQGVCHRCGQSLPAIESYQQHLRCVHCGADLRQLPIVPAADEVLAREARQQPDWQFLLDPAVSLVCDFAKETKLDVARQIGLKMRYLRQQRGESVIQFAKRSGVVESIVSKVESGWRTPLVAYQAYLDGMSLTWQELAAITMPAEYLARYSGPRHLSLRLCPNPTCDYHNLPSPKVILTGDQPDLQLARFHCQTCGRRFTRAYTGELVTKPRVPEGETRKYVLLKPKAEIERARQLGLQGKTDRAVAETLGWTAHNALSCWRVLGIYDEVREARRRHRQREKQQRRQALRERVDAILDEFCQQEEPITQARVGRALGKNMSYLRVDGHPEIVAHIKAIAQAHRSRRRQQRVERWQTQIEAIIASYQEQDIPLTIHKIAAEVGLVYWQLRDDYPELMALIRRSVCADREMRRNYQLAQQCVQISQAAARLTAQGVPLTRTAILAEARQHIPIDDSVPQVYEWLKWWIGNFGARD